MKSPIETLESYRAHDNTVSGLFQSRAERRSAEPFLLFDDVVRTWESFNSASQHLAAVLHDRGIRHGDRVACMATNNDAYVLLFLAICRLRAVLVPVNPDFNDNEAGYIMNHAGVVAVAATKATRAVARRACAGMSPGPWFMLLDDVGGEIGNAWDLGRTTSISSLSEDVHTDDLCLIMYTSGTTGFPKGVMHSQGNVVLAGEGFVERMCLQPEDRLLCVLPLFHINALLYSLAGTMAAGASLVLAPRFSASGFWPLAARSQATEVNIIAAVGNILAMRPRSEFDPLHKLQKVYGSPVAKEVAAVFKQEFGVPIVIEGYGMTEVPGAITMPFEGPYRYGSMGLPGRHPDHGRTFTELKVLDDHGNDVTDEAVGELAIRTPMVMKGYYRDPEQTAAAFRGDWFLTGDLVRRDAEGWYYFVSRKKDIIRKRGENISGAELDRVIGSHPAVGEAATLGVPSPLGDEDILVAVMVKNGASVTAVELADWCAGKLAAYKVPRYFAFVDDLPRTATQRVAKFKLAQDESLLRNAVDLESAGSEA